MNGTLVNSCLIPILQAQDAVVVTIEGLAAGDRLNQLQEAFLQCGGAQCGICTPGMILAASHLLQRKPDPSMDEIREGLSGNLCRCTGYIQIFEAVAEAARRRAPREIQSSGLPIGCAGQLAGRGVTAGDEPGAWLPIAGGTDLMVQYAARKTSGAKAGQHLESSRAATY